MVFEKIAEYFNTLITSPEMIIMFLISVSALTVLYFYIMKFLLNNHAGNLIWLFVGITFIVGAVILFNSKINNAFMLITPVILVIFVIILYPVEIRRIIWARKNMKMVDVKRDGGIYDEETVDKCITEIIKALQDMAKNDVGAIIVLSNDNIPDQILDSGVRIESDISSELIESVFFPKTPLHDGAMIINGTKIVAAGCFLPLTQRENVPKELGTRHRAGIGVTETMDVVSLIVSEETGIISVAKAGNITRYADTESLKKVLRKYYW